MEEKIGILSTKKLASNQKQYLLNAGFLVIDEDFITTKAISFEIQSLNDILIFTSQNAVQNVLQHKNELIDKPAICVGEKTKQLLENNGFNVLNSLADANQLIQVFEKEYIGTSVTFFCGKSRLNTIPDFLSKKNIQHEIIEVYETIETPIKIRTKMNGLLFFSPSGVSSFAKENTISNEMCFCIGTTTAKAVEKYSKNIIVANQPSVENVIIQCINYYKVN
ncbi:Uroporphyrinogen-III synthase [Flavobacterium indicum GPTSA100-9 = DSM 17447]|uniref:Uroporphyrinogen-III synthase n=1 Tax=Flavobacterium indicum (strain DSM 17447 / CIP 109464 / GPTSA100-9) TaxID=1094466 RepID=H8XNL8_FLAIG|nr:uroporphyrinogen-III synthase [Flavobacterium indicum]CCG52135.1 Uroporphyrinogen-III synthase [Flavobacterium indicum GPTSA100-9 = DSM 17447]